MLKLIYSEYDACKVFQFNYMTAILLDFLTEKVQVRNCATRQWSYSWGCFPTDKTMVLSWGDPVYVLKVPFLHLGVLGRVSALWRHAQHLHPSREANQALPV